MSFTYDEALGDDISRVRALIGDTTDPGKVSDELIQLALDGEGNIYEAGAYVADTLSAKYAGQASSRTIGSTSLSGLGDLVERYSSLAMRLRGHRRRVGTPIGFGWRKSEKEATERNADREPIISKKGGMDHPGTTEGI